MKGWPIIPIARWPGRDWTATSKSEGANPISDLLVAICWSPGLTWMQACEDQVAQPESTKVSATVRAALTIRMKEMELMDSESNGFSSWCSAQLLNLALSPSLQMNLQRMLQHILLSFFTIDHTFSHATYAGGVWF